MARKGVSCYVVSYVVNKSLCGSVTQVIGEQAIVDILDLSKLAWTCWRCTNTSSGLGLRMVKDSDM